jgi:hypothetical protein
VLATIHTTNIELSFSFGLLQEGYNAISANFIEACENDNVPELPKYYSLKMGLD